MVTTTHFVVVVVSIIAAAPVVTVEKATQLLVSILSIEESSIFSWLKQNIFVCK